MHIKYVSVCFPPPPVGDVGIPVVCVLVQAHWYINWQEIPTTRPGAQSDTSLLVAPYAVTPIDDCRIVAVSMTRLLNLAPAEWVPTRWFLVETSWILTTAVSSPNSLPAIGFKLLKVMTLFQKSL